ncbi:MAG: right-handed parallel beta-helix repeat-containing protein, partial [Phycisphaerales bacterium]|nr:right-handed parallel beta-helix repeat-containing protein [Phycisphaerales bacterium]
FGATLAGIGNSTIVNSAIAGIQLEDTGSAVAAVVANCIVRNNASAVVTVGPNAGMIARYSNIEGGFPGPGNIDLPAGFVDGPGGDYHLGAASPCVDAGDNNFVASDLTIDPDGTPRFLDDFGVADTGLGSAPIVDMGAYERKHPIRLVDGTATGGSHGLTWADAYVDLQDALDETASGEVEEVWVAAGTYLPDRGTGDRTLSFNMRSGVAIIGGFAGGETDAAARDPIANATTLGGAIGASGTADNSYHVVRADNVDSTGKLIGFIVQRGNADGPQATFDNRGGGLFIDGGGPTVRECRIRLNTCAAFGAGVFCEDADPEFGRCRVNLNESAGDGGGMAFFLSEPLIVDCSVNGNTADDEAGGLVFYSNSVGEIVNCSVTGNAAPTAPTGGLQVSGGSAVTVRNTVLWGNTGTSAFPQTQQLRVLTPSTLDIGSSTVEGWTGSLGGTANSGDDPLFVDIDGPDNIFGTADDDTHLLPGSPCIDSADASALPVQVSLDLSGDPRYMDDPGTADSGLGTPSFLDRGCYEFQGTSAPPCLADLDGDGLVDGADLGLLLANWGGAGSGDLDGSGTIDGADLGLLLAAWGNC